MKHELWMSNQMFLWGCQSKIRLIKSKNVSQNLINMSFTTISIIKVHIKLKLNRFWFSSQIMFVSHIINSLKINVNSFIRNNVESGSHVFTLWVMQLHKLIPAHFTDEPHSADLRSVSTQTLKMQLRPYRKTLQPTANKRRLKCATSQAYMSVGVGDGCISAEKRWFMFSALETLAPQWWLQKTVCMILKVHAKILRSAQNSKESF